MKSIFTSLFLLFWLNAFGQVVINNYPKIVPEGKKWILPTNQTVVIEVDRNTLNSGSLCNARILSNPKIVTGIVEGDYGKPNQIYGIVFNDLSRAGNDLTYSIVPLGLVNQDFEVSELELNAPNKVGQRQLVFYPGQKVYVGECLQGLQLIESNLTSKDIAVIAQSKAENKRLELEYKKTEELKKKNEAQEKQHKIVNSNKVFASHELTNEDNLKLLLQSTALPIIYNYLQHFKNESPDIYQRKVDLYEKKIKAASINGAKPEDYSMFELTLFFDKKGQLTKVINNMVLSGDEESERFKALTLGNDYLKLLRPLISLNQAGTINVDNKDYPVNFHCPMYFDFYENNIENIISFSKSKKGEIQITDNKSNLSNDDIRALIQEDDKINIDKKGEYLLNIKTASLVLEGEHFKNLGNKDVVLVESKKNSIQSIKKK